MRITARFERASTPTPTAEPLPAPAPDTMRGVSAAARNLALAHHLERLVDRGLIADYTHAARMLGVSQPRVTHIMGLLLLAPVIQEAILLGVMAPGDKQLRAVARIPHWQDQLEALRGAHPRRQ